MSKRGKNCPHELREDFFLATFGDWIGEEGDEWLNLGDEEDDLEPDFE